MRTDTFSGNDFPISVLVKLGICGILYFVLKKKLLFFNIIKSYVAEKNCN